MKALYLVHCGFYDNEISDGVYEFHVNIPVAATDEEDAKRQIHANPKFKARRMHIDGIHEIRSIPGFAVRLMPE